MIQRHRRDVPIVVHGDKLKSCYGDTPASWLVDQPGQVKLGDQPAGADESSSTDADRVGDASTGATTATVVHPGTRQPVRRFPPVKDGAEGEVDGGCPRPVRDRRLPSRFADYCL